MSNPTPEHIISQFQRTDRNRLGGSVDGPCGIEKPPVSDLRPAAERVILPRGVPRSVNLCENLFNNDYCRPFINHPVGDDPDLRELAGKCR